MPMAEMPFEWLENPPVPHRLIHRLGEGLVNSVRPARTGLGSISRRENVRTVRRRHVIWERLLELST